MPKDKKFHILVADRNPHIRRFLHRELSGEGYLVGTTGDGRDVLRQLQAGEPLDLLVLDLDLSFVDGLSVLDSIEQNERPAPVIVHTFLTQHLNHPAVQKAAAVVEKTGYNIDGLKRTVADVLRACYPQRFTSDNRPRLGQPSGTGGENRPARGIFRKGPDFSGGDFGE